MLQTMALGYIVGGRSEDAPCPIAIVHRRSSCCGRLYLRHNVVICIRSPFLNCILCLYAAWLVIHAHPRDEQQTWIARSHAHAQRIPCWRPVCVLLTSPLLLLSLLLFALLRIQVDMPARTTWYALFFFLSSPYPATSSLHSCMSSAILCQSLAPNLTTPSALSTPSPHRYAGPLSGRSRDATPHRHKLTMLRGNLCHGILLTWPTHLSCVL